MFGLGFHVLIHQFPNFHPSSCPASFSPSTSTWTSHVSSRGTGSHRSGKTVRVVECWKQNIIYGMIICDSYPVTPICFPYLFSSTRNHLTHTKDVYLSKTCRPNNFGFAKIARALTFPTLALQLITCTTCTFQFWFKVNTRTPTKIYARGSTISSSPYVDVNKGDKIGAWSMHMWSNLRCK